MELSVIAWVIKHEYNMVLL